MTHWSALLWLNIFSYFYLTPGNNLCITTEVINWAIKNEDIRSSHKKQGKG